SSVSPAPRCGVSSGSIASSGACERRPRFGRAPAAAPGRREGLVSENAGPTARLDYDDAYTTRFEARVLGAGPHRGRPALQLDATYFYPESGGQEADRGAIGRVPVVDVQSDEDGRVWHVIAPDAATPAGEAEAEVDWARRFDHMQQHTGQHVLSAAFDRLFGVRTESFHMGQLSSTIDLAREVSESEIAKAEDAANRIVWEDRPVAIK